MYIAYADKGVHVSLNWQQSSILHKKLRETFSRPIFQSPLTLYQNITFTVHEAVLFILSYSYNRDKKIPKE